jgi:hypothetical protein
MTRVAGTLAVALAVAALVFGALGVASAQDGTGTPSADGTGTPAGASTGTPSSLVTTTPAASATEESPLDTGEDQEGGAVGGATTAPSTGTGDGLPGGGSLTSLYLYTAAISAVGAGALYLGARRRSN